MHLFVFCIFKKAHNIWINPKINQLIYKCDYTHKLAIRTKNEQYWKQYRSLRNHVTYTIRKAKYGYYKHKIDSLLETRNKCGSSFSPITFLT